MIFRYLKYIITSKHRGYGIHAPFVYDLAIKVFKDKKKYSEFNEIEKIRKKHLNSKKKISVTDYGAGSKRMDSNMRRISEIVKYSSSSKKHGRLLFRLIKYFKPQTILELGTSFGIGTLYMSKANNHAETYTIEGCPEIFNIAKKNLLTKSSRIYIYNGRFKTVLKQILPNIKPDFIFIDGNHQKKAVLEYLNTLLPYCHNDTVIIFDDISWSKDMYNAWNIIKKNPKVTTSIDIFQYGIIFLKKELSKQHFKIYY